MEKQPLKGDTYFQSQE